MNHLGPEDRSRASEQDYTPTREYAFPSGSFWLFAVLFAFFFGWGAFSVWAAATNMDGSFPNPIPFAVVFGLFWSLFAIGTVWQGVYYWQHRLIFGRDTLRIVGVSGDQDVSRSDVARVEWRGFGGRGNAKLHLPRSRVVIDIGSHLISEQHDLIERLREFTRDAEQVHWERFCQPLFRLTWEERKRQSLGDGAICAVLLFLAAIAFAAAPAYGVSWRWSLWSIPLFIAAIFYVPRFRRRQREWSGYPDHLDGAPGPRAIKI
jgi:hypothetical protein